MQVKVLKTLSPESGPQTLKAHRPVYHSTLGLRVIKKKMKDPKPEGIEVCPGAVERREQRVVLVRPAVGVQGSGFRFQGSGFRVQGSGFRVQGSGFSVLGLRGNHQGFRA